MKTHSDYKAEACAAATIADDDWSAELHRIFGRDACQARYDGRGRGLAGSTLRRLHDHRQLCLGYWEAACIAQREAVHS